MKDAENVKEIIKKFKYIKNLRSISKQTLKSKTLTHWGIFEIML